MKKPNLLCAATFLSLVLSIPVFGGDVQTPTIVSPPPPPGAASIGLPDATAPGDMGSQNAGDTSSDPLIDLLLSMLSFF